jgi:hypothetical protein
MNTKCAGCPNVLKGVNFLNCCKCPDKYHYSCMNFNKQDFSSFSKEFNETWVCPSCRCKEPKRGDNTNTPISTPVLSSKGKSVDTTAPQHDNVTLRPKQRASETAKTSSCGCLTPDTIRDIIRQELDRKLNTVTSEIQLKLNAIEDSISYFNTEQEKIKSENQTHKAQLQELEAENEILRKTTRDISTRLLNLEQLSRANNLEIQCVPEHTSENIYNSVQQLSNIIKCPLSDTDIQYCSRIAKFNPNSPRPRSILVRFSSRRLRDTFLAASTKFNRNNPSDKLNTAHLGYGGKKSPVYVAEHLTSEAKSLHAAARLKAKELNFKFVWVRDGKVFMRNTESSSYILIKDLDVLSKVTK